LQEESFRNDGLLTRRGRAILLDRQLTLYQQAVEKNPRSEVCSPPLFSYECLIRSCFHRNWLLA
jgi:hypothetical protein